MTGKQRAVMWIGLILVTFNIVRRWQDISAIIFSGSTAPVSPPTTTPSSGGGNSVTVPIDPFLPTGPKITIPIPKLLGG